MERSPRANFILIITAFVIMGAGFFAWAHAQVVGVTLPSIPGNVSASAATSPGQVNVSWSASTESSGTIEGYYVYRNGGQIAVTAGTSIVDGGLSSGLYSYTVRAYDANGYESQPSATASVTLIADTTPPTTPTNVSLSGTTSTNSYYAQIPITISWSASTDNVGVVGYYVYRNNVAITSTTSTQSGTSITDTVVGPGTYTYTVAAYDAAQNVSARSNATTITITLDNIPPTVPTNVSVQQVSANGVNVSWAASTDVGGVAGYQVFRNGTQIASVSGPAFADSGLSTNVEYLYRIAAYDTAGNISSQSQPPAAVTIQPFNGAATPTITGSILVSTSTVDLSWAAGTDPLAITGYAIYRDGTQIASVTSTPTTYTDIGLTPGLHIYNLTATDVSGAVSAPSASSTVIVPIATAAATSGVTPSPTTTTTTASINVTTLPYVPPTTAPSTAVVSGTITQSLYYGLRNAQVSILQDILVSKGYLASIDATGFFGNLTFSAVEKFQCTESIVCNGGAGAGIVGPKTRAVLNAIGGETTSATVAASATATSPASASAMLTQIQTLEAELTALEAQLPTGK